MADKAGYVYMFEIVVLGAFLFYADIFSDVISLGRFWHHGQKCFFWINAGGIGLNMLASGVLCGLRGLRDGPCAGVAGFLQGFFQLHPLVTSWRVLSTGERLDEEEAMFNAVYRAFEFIESLCSLLVQGYVVVWDPSLSGSNAVQLQVSVCISMLSLANGLVSLDKTDDACEDGAKLATRPYGGFVVLTFVAACMVIVTGMRLYADVVGHRGNPEDFALYCGSALVSILPLCFFNASPALGAPSKKSPMNLGPPRLYYFVFRLTTVGLMFAYLVLRAGNVGAIWDFWKPYNASAIFLAYGVGISLVGYTTTFLLVWSLYPGKRSYSLLGDHALEE